MVIKAGGIHTMAEPREAGADQVRGILGPGRLAGFAAYPADRLSCSLDELAGLGPVLTLIGGRTRYDPTGSLRVVTNRPAPTRVLTGEL
jgi:predicted amidohydrolase YtcJ